MPSGTEQGDKDMPMRLHRAICTLGVAVAAILAAPANAQNTQGISDKTIKIGNLGPFTGDSSIFTPLNFGPDAFLRYTNAQGGVHGRTFETVFADDAVFMIMGHPCSGVAMAIKPMLEKEGVPWMGLAANPKLTRPTVPSMFSTYTGVESGSAMAAFALTKPGVKKIALVAHSNDWAAGYCNPATDYIKANGGEVVVSTAMERGSTDGTAQALQIKQSGAQAVMGCLYQQELVILLRDMAKYGVDAIVLGALGADFNQTVQQVGNPAAVKGKFFQPYQFQAKIGTGPLKQYRELFLKYLTKDELPKSGEPTNFYYFGVPVGIVTVEAFKRAGPQPTREKWLEAVESLKGFQTNVFADTANFSKDTHVGFQRMFAVGLNDAGEETVYTEYGKPLPPSGS